MFLCFLLAYYCDSCVCLWTFLLNLVNCRKFLGCWGRGVLLSPANLTLSPFSTLLTTFTLVVPWAVCKRSFYRYPRPVSTILLWLCLSLSFSIFPPSLCKVSMFLLPQAMSPVLNQAYTCGDLGRWEVDCFPWLSMSIPHSLQEKSEFSNKIELPSCVEFVDYIKGKSNFGHLSTQKERRKHWFSAALLNMWHFTVSFLCCMSSKVPKDQGRKSVEPLTEIFLVILIFKFIQASIYSRSDFLHEL